MKTIAIIGVFVFIGFIIYLHISNPKGSAKLDHDLLTLSTSLVARIISSHAAQPEPPVDPQVAARWPKSGQPWKNSLGVNFVPAGTDGILWGVWDVRVQDFQKFALETNYQTEKGMDVIALKSNPYGGYCEGPLFDPNASWANPGFNQGPTHPVVGVSWNDAHAYCHWLTERERKSGLIGPSQFYRLMTFAEWTKAVGTTQYPWGSNFPPSASDGNFRDRALASTFSRVRFLHNDSPLQPGELPTAVGPVLNINDGYDRTSPVGSYLPNSYGLFDMAGNVWQWVEDEGLTDTGPKTDENPGAFCGSCWDMVLADSLSSTALGKSTGLRNDMTGFRVVLVVAPKEP